MRFWLHRILISFGLFWFCSSFGVAQQGAPPAPSPKPAASVHHNVVLFITDGLRHDSVNPEDAAAIYALRQRGVDFANSHSLYPTFTTPNASAFATGHLLGDTGDFGNTLYVGQTLRSGTAAPLTPFIENNSFLAQLNQLFNGNYLQEETLLSLARRNGYATAAIGKVGPTAIQAIDEVKSASDGFQPAESIIVDDSTSPDGIPLSDVILRGMKSLGLSYSTPDRSNGQSGKQNNGLSGTLAANWSQQQYLANVATQIVLPAFQQSAQPWLLVFWSRDPDGTQHNQGDSIGQLFPGINGPTSRAAIHNADNNLWQIITYLKANQILDQTDIIVVADHGFSTISRREIARNGAATTSYAASKLYAGVEEGFLPPGFLAIDLAHALKLPLYDPDAPLLVINNGISRQYQPVNLRDDSRFAAHPQNGNGLIGGSGKVPLGTQPTDAEIIVAANGGSDLIYLPGKEADANKKLANSVAEFLLRQDYVDGIFVRDDLGDIPGTLPMSSIGLMGATKMPKPAMYVNFKSFSMNQSLLTRVEIADTTLQEGQGMHGSFSRADTFNNMAAAGPDFKSGYVDHAPASNADIAVTVAHILGLTFDQSHGTARGRVLSEALANSPDVAEPKKMKKVSVHPGPDGARTLLIYQTLGDHTYFDQGCLVRSSQIESGECK